MHAKLPMLVLFITCLTLLILKPPNVDTAVYHFSSPQSSVDIKGTRQRVFVSHLCLTNTLPLRLCFPEGFFSFLVGFFGFVFWVFLSPEGNLVQHYVVRTMCLLFTM